MIMMETNIMVYGIIAFLVIVLIAFSMFTVAQQEIAVVERFGKFARIAGPGLNVKIPIIDQVSGKVSLRVRQLDVKVETKTKDNVFVNIVASVQFQVLSDKVFDAFYKLTDARTQIQSYVFDVIRAKVPTMELDSVFENKDSIATAVKEELTEVMTNFGYSIVKALITDIDPDAKVKAAMNEINEKRRLRMAAQEQGEAEKIIKVKKAEAEAEAMRLSGQGVADQRKAIINGLRDSISDFGETVPGVSVAEALKLVLTTQYYDMLKEVGANNRANTILLPHQAPEASEMGQMLRDNIMAAQLATQKNQED
jgi:regulator of protease activity HflC (stomatin/prohibitin superfamily)